MLMWFSKFSPNHVVSGQTSSIIPILLKMFPNEHMHYNAINMQYRALADLPYLKTLKDHNICKFWSKISKIKDELDEFMFLDISRIVTGILSIPHSSANVERAFSYQNVIKSKERNRLNVSTLSSIIQTKDLLKSKNCSCFDLDIKNN